MQFKINKTDLNIIESIKTKIDNKTFILSDEFYHGINLEIDLPDLDAEMFGCWNSNCENKLQKSQEDSLHQRFLVDLLNKYNEKNTNSKNQVRFLFGDNMYFDKKIKKTLKTPENKDIKKQIVHADLTSSIPLVNGVDLRDYSAKALDKGFDGCLGANKPSFITLGNHDVEPLFTMYQQINKCYNGIEIYKNGEVNNIQFHTNWILPNAFYSVKINLPNMSLVFIIMDTNLIDYQYHHLILSIDSQTKYIDIMLKFIERTLITNKDSLKFVIGHIPIFYIGHKTKEPIFQTRHVLHNSKVHEHTIPKITNGFIKMYKMMIDNNVKFYMCADEHNLQFLEDKQHKINFLICGASPGGSGADESATFKSNKDEILFSGDIKIPNDILQHLDKKIIINAPSFMKLVTHHNTIQINMIAPEKLTQHSAAICSKPNGCIYTDLSNANPSLYYSLTIPKHTEYVSVYNCDEFKKEQCK